ncbi:amidohydrolase family protein [Variovorax sp. RA8]|uniref:amidohydrolase family protein n=1 Tax=Variovorax sp. (strain JCM 16519 / RA8) TaxID=662548 RepID=UPI001E4E9F8D|nr:amidohydrolase family protein [Variovorax sp. RA8]
MPVVDAHHHLWDLSRGNYPWLQQAYDPQGFFLGEYEALRRNFLPADYRAASAGVRVLATVHVEAERDRSEQVAETAWLHEMNAAYALPNAVVAHAWLDRPDTEECLLDHLRYPLVRGIRCKPVTSAVPGQSVAGHAGSMQDAAWLRGFSLLEKHGLSWDMRVPAWHLAEAAQVAAMFPRVPMVLNHHGLAWDRSEEGLARWRGGMEILARQPNVHVKLSEFGLRDAPWDWEANARIVRDTMAIFGWQRCMFASNFPVTGLRIGFEPLVQGVSRMLDELTPDQRQAVMSGNALRFYRIELPPSSELCT